MVHIGASATPEFRDIRERLRRLRVRLGELKAQHAHAHPEWDGGLDARLTGFGKLANVIESAELSLKFLDEELASAEWWQANYGFLPKVSDVSIYVREFSQYSKAGLLQLSFGSIESTLRIFLRALDPAACLGSTTEFKSVYECLFHTKLTGLSQASLLLDFFRALRNTVHNNGVYYHKSGRGAAHTYKGVTYEFPIGHPVDFATWVLVVSLVSDATELLNDVVCAPEMNMISEPIRDPYSHPKVHA